MMRKGQKLCNWIVKRGTKNEDVHKVLFYMTDEEFNEAVMDELQRQTLAYLRKNIANKFDIIIEYKPIIFRYKSCTAPIGQFCSKHQCMHKEKKI